MSAPAFSRDLLRLDAEAEIDRIAGAIKTMLGRRLRRRGAVVAVSGGIDSSVVAALCVRAIGHDRVFALRLPERESSDETRALSHKLVEWLGVEAETVDITATLEAAGCYEARDEAIREVVSDYGPGWKAKIVLPPVVDSDSLRVFSVVVLAPDGHKTQRRMSPEAYLKLVAATNFKQRTRTMLSYYHADRLNYAVAGTPNLLEYDQGFFVKGGDGLADFKPIAHLYKTQVYQLAAALGVPDEIRRRPPTTDTYSMSQSQEEFYFSLPYDQMDLCLYARNHGVSPEDVAPVLGVAPRDIERVYRDIEAKRAMAEYLHAPPLTLIDEPR